MYSEPCTVIDRIGNYYSAMASSYQFSDGFQVREEVSVLHKLCNETEGLLDGDTANELDDVRVVAFRYLLHCVNLIQEVSSLTSCGTGCMGGEHKE